MVVCQPFFTFFYNITEIFPKISTQGLSRRQAHAIMIAILTDRGIFMTAWAEFLKGATDLPLVLLALIFFGMLKRQKNGRWVGVFGMIAAAAALGVAVHSIAMPTWCVHGIWVALFPLLFESIRRFSVRFTEYIAKKERQTPPAAFIMQATLCVCAVITEFLFPDFSLLFLVAFTLLCLATIIICCVRVNAVPPKARILLWSLPIPILLQAFSGFIPYSIVTEHIFLAAEMVLTYFIAKENP